MRLAPVYRIVTFVPPRFRAKVIRSAMRAVDLRYGKYTDVAWWSAVGTEQFRPLPGSQPTSGRHGVLARLPSVRLEFSVPRDRKLLERVVQKGIRAVHPWQEPVIIVTEVMESRRSAR